MGDRVEVLHCNFNSLKGEVRASYRYLFCRMTDAGGCNCTAILVL